MAILKTYVVLYHMNAAAQRQAAKTTKEASAAGMQAWMTWAKECGDGLVNLGAPLGKGLKLNSTGAAPSKRNVAGYSILQAQNMTAARKMLKNHPHLGWSTGCDIEIHETMPMPGSK